MHEFLDSLVSKVCPIDGPNAVGLSGERIIRFLFFLVSNQPVMWTEITKYWAKVVQILGNFLEFESLDFSSFAYHDTPESTI